MKQFLVLLLPVFLMLSCKEKDPFLVSPSKLGQPSAPAQIDRDRLVQNNSFQPGYSNGTIRSTQATISWKRCTDPDFLCYKIYRDNTELRDIDSAQTDSLVDKRLVPNTWYRYTVATVLKSGVSKSDTITIKTPKFLPPVIGVLRTHPETGGVFINWTNQAENSDNIVIERGIPGEAYSVVATPGKMDMTFYDTTVAPGNNTYTYRLSAWSRYEGPTAYSALRSVVYSMTAPSNVSAIQIGMTHAVKVTFADNSTAESGYKIYRKKINGSYTVIATLPANATQYTDSDAVALTNGSSFAYKVECYNRRHSVFSAEKAVLITMPVLVCLPWSQEFWPSAGSSTSASLSVRNTGSTPVTVSSVVSSNPRFVVSPSEGFVLNAGATKFFTVTYTPTDTLEQNGTITFITSASSALSGVVVKGVGRPAPAILTEGFEGSSSALPAGWTTSGEVGWTISSVLPFQGSYCARSGMIGSLSQSTLSKSISFTGMKMISFNYRVSSASGSDFLKFFINGVQYGSSWSGETGWQSCSVFYTGSGMTTLTWTYSKDITYERGSDAAWIDDVVIQ